MPIFSRTPPQHIHHSGSSGTPVRSTHRLDRDPPLDSQHDAGNQAVQPLLAQAGDVVRTPGKPLDPTVRAGAEARLGWDFSRVRVHDDQAAAASADAAGARAYTVGSHIAFGRGEYRPHDQSGRRIMLHELVHVAQQGDQPALQPEPRLITRPQDQAECEAHDIANNTDMVPSLQPSHRTAVPSLARYPKEGQDLQERKSEALQHGQNPDDLPPRTDPLEPLKKEAERLGPIPAPPPEPTIPGNDAQQQKAIPLVNSRDLFEQPEIQRRLQAAAADAEARERAKPGGKVTHSVDSLMSFWEDHFVDSVDYILYKRGVPMTRKQMMERLEKEEKKLIKANPPDLIDQIETLREKLGAEWKAKVQLAADRFVVVAENEAKFATVHQNAASVRVQGLPDTMEPATSAAAHPGVIQKGSADVAESVVTFMEAVQKESKIKAEAENYDKHELGSDWLGGDPAHVGHYSFDVHLDDFMKKTADGFYDRNAVAEYFFAVDRAAKATGMEWVAYYNDFEVAKNVNEKLGGLHVGFSGGGGHPPFQKGSFHHGPQPYILHIHFNIMPIKLKEKFDQQVALKKLVSRILPFLEHFNPR
jgi:hypothetical protein